MVVLPEETFHMLNLRTPAVPRLKATASLSLIDRIDGPRVPSVRNHLKRDDVAKKTLAADGLTFIAVDTE